MHRCLCSFRDMSPMAPPQVQATTGISFLLAPTSTETAISSALLWQHPGFVTTLLDRGEAKQLCLMAWFLPLLSSELAAWAPFLFRFRLRMIHWLAQLVVGKVTPTISRPGTVGARKIRVKLCCTK